VHRRRCVWQGKTEPMRPPLLVLLAEPRGFCAGVEFAIQHVERALALYGAPVYVRHEIVHNQHVVGDLRRRGAVFVESLDEVPDDRPVVFSAHGVPRTVPEAAEARGLFYLDATCPLVGKVHREALRHYNAGRRILLIGHAGHPEVVGTMGQVPEGAMQLVQNVEEAEAIDPGPCDGLAYITQTTLSVDDAAAIIDVLKRRFPDIEGPHREDICFATTNRQQAVKALAACADRVLVLGAPNSSNTRRLAEVAGRQGTPAHRVAEAADIDWAVLGTPAKLGITAGASTPEHLVQAVVDACAERFEVTTAALRVADEGTGFRLPHVLRE